MPLSHIILALTVTLVWGFNFVAIYYGLEGISPLLLGFTRLFLTSIPAVFFIKRPNAPAFLIILYGLTMFALQFALGFLGINAGVSGGLGSILMQLQVFFTVFLSVFLFKEKIGVWHLVGAFISFSGMLLIGVNVGGEETWTGVILMISAAASWSAGNIISKYIGKVNIMSLVIWGSFAAWPPLLLISLLWEGVDNIFDTIQNLTWSAGGAALYITLLSTLFGYGVWGWLIRLYPLSTIAPFTLLVPVFGILSSAWILGEPLHPWKLMAAALVISGLCINMFGPKLQLAWERARE